MIRASSCSRTPLRGSLLLATAASSEQQPGTQGSERAALPRGCALLQQRVRRRQVKLLLLKLYFSLTAPANCRAAACSNCVQTAAASRRTHRPASSSPSLVATVTAASTSASNSARLCGWQQRRNKAWNVRHDPPCAPQERRVDAMLATGEGAQRKAGCRPPTCWIIWYNKRSEAEAACGAANFKKSACFIISASLNTACTRVKKEGAQKGGCTGNPGGGGHLAREGKRGAEGAEEPGCCRA